MKKGKVRKIYSSPFCSKVFTPWLLMHSVFFLFVFYILPILNRGCKLLISTVANAFVRSCSSWSENQVCSGALLGSSLEKRSVFALANSTV